MEPRWCALQRSGFAVKELNYTGFTIEGVGFRVKGLGFRV